jgi:ectoine hydroxylase-related dioxygenase (phytanoyl-CoA dioxygenase family)
VRVVALRLHLDHSTEVNGPLRVLPGSHRLGVLSDEDVAAYARHHAGREMACLVPKGGVLAMSPLLIHSSAKVISNQPRRVLHIEYASPLDIATGLRLAIA